MMARTQCRVRRGAAEQVKPAAGRAVSVAPGVPVGKEVVQNYVLFLPEVDCLTAVDGLHPVAKATSQAARKPSLAMGKYHLQPGLVQWSRARPRIYGLRNRVDRASMFAVLPQANQIKSLCQQAAQRGLWRGFYFWYLFTGAQGLLKPRAH
jgi:hypothetical protein